MQNLKRKLIDKKYVHKIKDDNVLIYNLRRAIPIKIKNEIFENIISSNINKKEKILLSRYYNLFKYNNNSIHVLNSIPYILNNNFVENLSGDNYIFNNDLNVLNKYYEKQEGKNTFLLKNDITEIDEIEIIKFFNKTDQQLIDQENREILSTVFESLENFEKPEIFYANLFANCNHPFFFEHPVDHIPGMMIIEASRQLLIAISHVFGKIPLEGINFVLSEIKINFNSYLELNRPIKILSQVIKVNRGKNGLWKNKIDLDVYFYQNNKKCAVINYLGRILSNSQFAFLRKNKLDN